MPSREEAIRSEFFHYAEIGRFIVTFSQVEFTLKVFLGGLLRLKDEKLDAVMSGVDFTSLCRIVKTIYGGVHRRAPNRVKRVHAVIDEIIKVNNEHRVPIVHSTWAGTARGFVARHTSRQTHRVKYVYATSDELAKVTDHLGTLHSRLFEAGKRSRRK